MTSAVLSSHEMNIGLERFWCSVCQMWVNADRCVHELTFHEGERTTTTERIIEARERKSDYARKKESRRRLSRTIKRLPGDNQARLVVR
jgi:hypothetical protein